MKLPVHQPAEASLLWRATAHGRQTVPPGRPYWFENATRSPTGVIVVQATLAGTIVYRDDADERPVEPGQIVIFAWGERSAYGLTQTRSEPYICEWINLDGAGLREHLDALRQRHGSVLDTTTDSTLLDELRTVGATARPDARVTATTAAATVHHFVMRLIEHAERRHVAALTPVEQAVEQMLRQPLAPWSLKELADHFGVSREHFSRVFRARTGRTPAAFQNRARLNRALALLRQTDLSMQAIAQQTGFASLHTMARHVRTATGQAPSALRPPKPPSHARGG